MTKNFISLTTIPPRFSLIEPTLVSLLDQTADIEAVLLWIPERYQRFDFCEADLRGLPFGVEVRRCAVDYGPATKILPAIEAFKGEDVRIIYCDDDRIYDPEWAVNIFASSNDYPSACIAEVGETVRYTLERAKLSSAKYKQLKRLTLGIYGHRTRKRHRQRDQSSDHLDIAKGFGGVMVRPDFLGELAFNIPQDLAVVDDIWLSGCLAVNEVMIRSSGGKVRSKITTTAQQDALIDLVHFGLDRNGANLACIHYFQTNFGIWK